MKQERKHVCTHMHIFLRQIYWTECNTVASEPTPMRATVLYRSCLRASFKNRPTWEYTLPITRKKSRERELLDSNLVNGRERELHYDMVYMLEAYCKHKPTQAKASKTHSRRYCRRRQRRIHPAH